jgi:hypothetical protein
MVQAVAKIDRAGRTLLLARSASAVVALAVLLATATLAAADGIRVPGGAAPVRPEIRSYQPYSGLQFGFRPEPPVDRREPERPRVVRPEAVPPLIRSGPPLPHDAQYYGYCARRGRCP